MLIVILLLNIYKLRVTHDSKALPT